MGWYLLQDLLALVLLVAVSIPLGLYIYKILAGKRVFLSRVLEPVERATYRVMGVDPKQSMSAKQYSIALLVFSGIGLLLVFLFQLTQGILPLNPEHMGPVSPDLAFNTAASFLTNTNWQAYAGESTLSYLTQMLGLTVQNFVSAAAGTAVLFALIRGIVQKQKAGIGNFWSDVVRITLYVLIPLSLIFALILVSQGVVQNFAPYQTVSALESGAQSVIPGGPAASQIAIKQLGSNGGGFFGQNSAYPLENPTALSNLLEVLSIILIPAALCVTFGKAVKDMKQGRVIYIVMLVIMVVLMVGALVGEIYMAPQFAGVAGNVNMEGKEALHGIGGSSFWSVITTSASNGAVNSMLDSMTPVGGLVPLFLMQLGEIVFGGLGSGLYAMLAFVILTVFIAGLMVGRTPEYLGKKIEPFDMKMVCVVVLVPALVALISTAAAMLMPAASEWVKNSGAHGFTEVLYTFTSMAANNGSAFAGFAGDTPFTNIVGGIVMLVVRFAPMVAVLYLAQNLGSKKLVAKSEGTLSTSNAMFAGLLIAVILLIAALSFLPALSLGPIAEAFVG